MHPIVKKHRIDAEIDTNLDNLQKHLMHQHVSNLHKKLRTPPAGAPSEPHEDMGETPDEEKSEHEQMDGMPHHPGHVAPEHHADILKEMLDPGEGEHEEEKADEMERQELPTVHSSKVGEQHEPVYEEEHDSKPHHMRSGLHKKKFKGI